MLMAAYSLPWKLSEDHDYRLFILIAPELSAQKALSTDDWVNDSHGKRKHIILCISQLESKF